jgi:hypothetical protein
MNTEVIERFDEKEALQEKLTQFYENNTELQTELDDALSFYKSTDFQTLFSLFISPPNQFSTRQIKLLVEKYDIKMATMTHCYFNTIDKRNDIEKARAVEILKLLTKHLHQKLIKEKCS